MKTFVVFLALILASCGPSSAPTDAARDASVETDGGVCVETFQAPCERAPCCAGMVCRAGVCLLDVGALCRFPWQCASDSCLAPAMEPGVSRCTGPR